MSTDVYIEASQQPAPLDALSTPRSPSSKGPRTPRKIGAQPTKLEAVDDSLDPLGPLGDPSFATVDQGPTPPQKETIPSRNVRPATSASQSSTSAGLMDSVDLEDDGQMRPRMRVPPPVQPPPTGIDTPKRQTQPSISVEQAAKPTFEITVGDPHKVGDLTSSHTVYQVRTKVGIQSLLYLACCS